METAVRKATRLEYRPPKEKHLLTLKNLTFESPASIDGILMNLEKRLKERSWIITYKVLVIIHYLMREGNSVPVIDAVLRHPNVLDTSRIKNKTHTHNIYLYRAYLDERVIAFRHLKRDYVAESSAKQEGRLRHLLVKDGLLKETIALQRQMESVFKCKFLDENDPQITWFAYKMVVEDLLALFQAVNEGVANILEHYFEMNTSDATAALDIYKTFVQLVELTIAYLNEARRLENDIELSIPPIKHAPLSLAVALEEYLNDRPNNDSQAKVSRNNTVQRPHSLNQQPMQQSIQQPIIQPMQQPMQQPIIQPMQQPIIQPAQQPIDPIQNNHPFGTLTFSSPPQRIIASPQSSFALQNPFLDHTSLPFSESPSSFATMSAQGYPSFSPVSPLSASADHSNNPFRSMSILSPLQPPQQITVAPHHQQALPPQAATSSYNPFSPLPLNPQPTSSCASNPFMTQQH